MGLIMRWLQLVKDRGPNASKLEEYEYEVIKHLAAIEIEPYQLADLLDMSESRARYELNKVKNGTANNK
jgi:hypothetical protein